MPLSTKSDLTGLRTQAVTILKRVQPSCKSNGYQTKWLCRCDCGSEIVVSEYLLRKNRPKSCGCLNGQIIAEVNKSRRNPIATSLKHYYRVHKNCAKRQHTSPLPRETWESLVKQPCKYCGNIDERRRPRSHRQENKYSKFSHEEEKEYTVRINGVDRLDTTQGYTTDNSVSCCRMCNIMKNGYTEDDFLQKTKQIYEYRQLNNLCKRPVCYTTSTDHHLSKLNAR